MTTGRINQITILKEEATSSKKRNRNLFFSHLFPLARRYLLSLETAEIPEKIAFFRSLCCRKCSLFKKSFYTLDQRTPSPYHSTLLSFL
nr:ASB_HP1_G0036500.mRNA.1.CDS.1 [Saccharomyces cerevisiae]